VLRREFSSVPVIALTATATEKVKSKCDVDEGKREKNISIRHRKG
jgi:superfamily II DNA helicase RecQ